jgi:predicted DNA-binding transcriptional regulator YafY
MKERVMKNVVLRIAQHNNSRVFVEYLNGKGEYSRRVVRITCWNDSQFWGHCELRGEERVFRFDRLIFAGKPKN